MKLATFMFALAATAGAFAQEGSTPPASTAPTFKSDADIVVLHVNVFDRRSDAVPNLPQSAFTVVEEEAPQAISFFSNEDVPVAVGLILDNSGSMIARHGMVAAGTRVFGEASHPEDQLFTIIFNEHVRYGLPEGAPFTQNRVQIQATLNLFSASGKTALYDAVIEGLEHLEEASHQKRVLVVLSDGDDNASMQSEETMLERARRSDALIYTVSTADLTTANGGKPRVLRKLAEATGGVAYMPDTEKQVVDAFREIAGNIRRGYSIGYVPTDAAHDGRFRHVKVIVRAPGYKNLTVRTRDGYLAPRNADTH